MTRLITIRPEPGASATVEAARQQGRVVEAFPLSTIVPLFWQGPDPESVDALLIGSGNAMRHGGEELRRYIDKPLFAVGGATAEVARSAGFQVQMVGEGKLQGVIDRIEGGTMRLLRLTGERNVPIQLPRGVEVETRILYKAENVPMPDALVQALGKDALVMLHSAGAAEHFRSECERCGLDLSAIRIAALGPRIADAAGRGWDEVRFAPQPAGPALLALSLDMCH